MKQYLKANILLSALLLNAHLLLAQYHISGKINDTQTQTLPFSNVVLYQAENDEFVKGVVSNEVGFYKIEKIAEGEYWLEVSSLGFNNFKSEVFLLNSNKEFNIILEENLQTLEQVTVQSVRPRIEQSAEKLIVDISNSTMVGANLKDVVKKVPGLLLINDQVRYGGQEGVRILINGRSTDYMDTEALLNDLPADNIEKIELINQPGAEFEAEGSGPILNIILKKNKTFGTHGSVKTYVGYDNEPEYSGRVSISSYKNNINWNASTGYRKVAWRDELYITRQVGESVYDQSTISPFNPESFEINAGIDYHLKKNQTVGFSTQNSLRNSNRITSNETSILTAEEKNTLFTESSFDRERLIHSLNPYYSYKGERNELELQFDYVFYDNGNKNNLYQIKESAIQYDNQRYLQEESYRIYTYKGDYKHRFNEKISLHTGFKYDQVDISNNLRSFTQNSVGDFELAPRQSNEFLINENIAALYMKTSMTFEKWDISAGLRWEDSMTKGTSKNTEESRTRSISKFFPSASVSRKLSKKIKGVMAYSYRINRPSYGSLNTFVYYYDPYTFEQGNPNLNPELTNSLRFNLTYDDQPFFKIERNTTKQALFELILQNDETGQTSRSEINIEDRENWSFSLFAPLNIVKNMGGYTGINVNYNEFHSSDLTPLLEIKKWSWTWFANIDIALPGDINAEISGYYTSGGINGQIEFDWMSGMSFAMSKKFMDDKLKVNLGIDKILNRPFEGHIDYGNVKANIRNDWSRQNVYLQLNYNFGHKYGDRKKKNNSTQDLENRIDSNN